MRGRLTEFCTEGFRKTRRPAQARFRKFCIALSVPPAILTRSKQLLKIALNSELSKKALEIVGNPNVLINLISRRVRQLNAGGGGMNRPLIHVTPGMGMADVALTEIIEEKIGFILPEPVAAIRPTPKKRKKH